MFKKKKIELYKFKGCKDCSKNCLFNDLVAVKEIAERNKNKFPCNSKIEKIK